MHTPGPWIVESGAVYTADHIPIAAMDREPGNGTQPVERDANARLIAAAPKLLEALEAIVAKPTLAQTSSVAQDVIAEAKGE